MVSTRSNRANEPLKRLETPPKRTRKDPKSSAPVPTTDHGPQPKEKSASPMLVKSLKSRINKKRAHPSEDAQIASNESPESPRPDLKETPSEIQMPAPDSVEPTSAPMASTPQPVPRAFVHAFTQTDPVYILTLDLEHSAGLIQSTPVVPETIPDVTMQASPVVTIIDDDDRPVELPPAPKSTPKQPRHARPRPQTEPRHPTNTNNKRVRDVSPENEDDAAPRSKRRAKITSTPSVTQPNNPFWMFDTKSDSDDDTPARPQPQPRTWAERLKKERKDRERKKRLAALAATPPRAHIHHRTSRPPPSSLATSALNVQDSPLRRLPPASDPSPAPSDPERHNREERSAAPEPETPKPSLFGSLRSIGSATVNRLFGSSPAKKVEQELDAATSAQQSPIKPSPQLSERSVQYPSIEPVEEEPESQTKDTALTPNTKPTSPQANTSSAAVPATPATEPAPRRRKPHTITAAEREFYSARKQRRQNLFASNTENSPEVNPIFAEPRHPLFGPNSLYAQGIKPKEYISPYSPNVLLTKKRRLDELTGAQPEPSKPKPFSPDAMDEDESSSLQSSREGSDELTTPAAKRQKFLEVAPQTPRSAMKKAATLGASVGRSAKSVNFNANPVSEYKTISPVMGRESVLEYKHRPGKLFSLQSDIDAYEQEIAQQQQAVSPNPSLDNSPNTQSNTNHNRFSGLKSHPGSALTEAINEKAGGRNIEFVWSDPNDPDWKPSLGNPSPGTFSSEFLDQMDDDGNVVIPELEIDDEDETVSPAKKPVQPQTPRMSHAELPKSAAASTPPPTETVSDTTQRNLAKARENAEKFKPRSHSRLSNVTAARSRSPSPPLDGSAHMPDLAADDGASVSGASDGAHTPPPFETRVFKTETGVTSIIDPADNTLPKPEWTWCEATEEHLSNHPSYPDFQANRWGELVPSMTLRTPSGERDDTIVGPDNMTSKTRDEIRMAEAMKIDFAFDPPQTYEEAGTGSAYVVQLINKVEAANPNIMNNESWDKEWEEHGKAIEAARLEGRRLVATYGNEEEEEL